MNQVVSKADIINLEKGKIPPQAVDIEEIVLGALISDRKGVDEVLPILKQSEVFYKDAHRWIYEAIMQLYNENNPIDLLTVSQQLRKIEKLDLVGGDYYLINLTQKVSSSAHSEYHARILHQKWMARQLIKISSRCIEYAYDESQDVFDTMDFLGMSIDSINTEIASNSNQLSFPEALKKVVDNVESITNMKEGELTGVPTGFKRLNELTSGWQNSDLIIIAGRPGMGKSAFCSATILSAVKSGFPVGVLSLEMSTIQFTTRLMANNSHFHLNQLFRKGFRDDPEHKQSEYFLKLTHLRNEMNGYPVFFNDTPAMDVREIKATARLWKRKNNIKLLIVDYLQLAKDRSKDKFREQEISSISGTLKAIAKELDIPVIALSQLSRKVEDRGGDKIPKLSDIRESGAIEQDADLIAFLWRPEYYKLDVPESLLNKGANTALFVQKHRNGSLDDIGLYFDSNKTKFCDVSEKEVQQDHFI